MADETNVGRSSDLPLNRLGLTPRSLWVGLNWAMTGDGDREWLGDW